MPDAFTVRRATPADVSTIARHRAEMFTDMGELPAHLYEDLVIRSTRYLEAAIPSEEYVGWLAAPEGAPQQIVAGAGVQRRRVLPHPLRAADAVLITRGEQGVVLNVFTERAWRRQGLAELLMRHVLAWASSARLDTLVLHTSTEGQRLYERLGFVPTNEMRYAGSLSGHFPRYLRVMADYGSSGIWVASGMIEHRRLGLPEELAAAFAAWIEKYWARADDKPFDVNAFNAEGRRLAIALKQFVGPETRVVFEPETDEVSGLGEAEDIT